MFNILLQVLDEGRLTDGKGRVVNFKNTVIILTSNIGSEYIQKMESIGFSDGDEKTEYGKTKEKVLESLKNHFRPEFLNRLDEIVVFDILSQEAILEIVSLRVDVVRDRLAGKEINLEVSTEALEYLAKEGYDPQYGARPLNRLIQTKILNPIAEKIISGEAGEGTKIFVSMKAEELYIDIKGVKKKKAVKKKTLA